MRIGVIGLGTIGQTHVEALRELGVEHVFGADPADAARRRLEDSLVVSFADYHEMLSSAELDGVVVATPPRTHRQIAMDALDAARGVLCEKPLALTLQDCETIAAAVERSGRYFQVGFCHRFQPQLSALHSLLASGALGLPVLVKISFIHGLSTQNREWITDADQAGGGVLFDSGSHAIDLFRYLVGDVDEVLGLTAQLEGEPRRWRVEDTAALSLRSGSVLGTIALSWKTPPWQGLIEVVGEAGQVRVQYEGDTASLEMRLGEASWRAVPTPTESRFSAQMRHFLACLSGDHRAEATVRDGVEATRIVLGVYARRAAAIR